MKRVHTLVSRSEAADTPLPVLGKKCRQHGLVGTPVEGLTGMPVTAIPLEEPVSPVLAHPGKRTELAVGLCRLTPPPQIQTACIGLRFQTLRSAGLRASASIRP